VVELAWIDSDGVECQAVVMGIFARAVWRVLSTMRLAKDLPGKVRVITLGEYRGSDPRSFDERHDHFDLKVLRDR